MAKKMLITYYSFGGNTKKIAEKLQKETGADIAELKPVKPYTGSYNDVVKQGQEEVNRGYEPKIEDLQVNLADYDIIVVGTPTWWYTMAPVVHTFLAENDFTGKTIIPYMTNAGWPGTVIKDMKKTVKEANVVAQKEFLFDAQGNGQMKTSVAELDQWIAELKELILSA